MVQRAVASSLQRAVAPSQTKKHLNGYGCGSLVAATGGRLAANAETLKWHLNGYRCGFQVKIIPSKTPPEHLQKNMKTLTNTYEHLRTLTKKYETYQNSYEHL